MNMYIALKCKTVMARDCMSSVYRSMQVQSCMYIQVLIRMDRP